MHSYGHCHDGTGPEPSPLPPWTLFSGVGVGDTQLTALLSTHKRGPRHGPRHRIDTRGDPEDPPAFRIEPGTPERTACCGQGASPGEPCTRKAGVKSGSCTRSGSSQARGEHRLLRTGCFPPESCRPSGCRIEPGPSGCTVCCGQGAPPREPCRCGTKCCDPACMVLIDRGPHLEMDTREGCVLVVGPLGSPWDCDTPPRSFSSCARRDLFAGPAF